MTSPDAIPAAIAIPGALLLLWAAIADLLPIGWPKQARWLREHFTRHEWVGVSSRICIKHNRCRGDIRFYNDRGVRLCDAWAPLVDGDSPLWLRRPCDLHYGHRPKVHYSIAADRTWT